MAEEMKGNDAGPEGVTGGDVLTGIAPRFGVAVKQIQDRNNIKNPNGISVGQKLTVHPAVIR